MSANSQQVWMLLKSRRRMEMRKDGTFPTFKEPTTEMGWPAAIQASYAKLLVDTMQGLNRAFFPEVKRQLPGWIDEAARAHRVDGEIRLDGFFMDMSVLKDKLTNMVKTWFGEKTSLTVAVFGVGNKTNRFNLGRVQGNIESVVKASFYPNEPWVTGTIKEWSETNLDLVKSLTGEYIVKMNETVQSAVVSGKTYQAVMDDLLRMGQGLTVARAKLIAVDQLGKLYGALTMARYQEAGLDLYEWRTSQDERVRGKPGGKYPNARPSHWAIHGMVCKWSNGSVWRQPGSKVWSPRPGSVPLGIPGFPIRCRCHAKPIWAELVSAVDAELRNEAA